MVEKYIGYAIGARASIHCGPGLRNVDYIDIYQIYQINAIHPKILRTLDIVINKRVCMRAQDKNPATVLHVCAFLGEL